MCGMCERMYLYVHLVSMPRENCLTAILMHKLEILMLCAFLALSLSHSLFFFRIEISSKLYRCVVRRLL